MISSNSPLFPIHVIQPYPAILNPNWSKYYYNPLFDKYFWTTPEPGDRLVLMYGLTFNPFSIAFLANNAAYKMTSGLEVLVQLVIDAITRLPLSKMYFSFSYSTSTFWSIFY